MTNIYMINNSAIIFITPEKKMLIIQLNYGLNKYNWCVPGGRIDTKKGEQPLEWALREFEEEIGIKIDNKLIIKKFAFDYIPLNKINDLKWNTRIFVFLSSQKLSNINLQKNEIIHYHFIKIDDEFLNYLKWYKTDSKYKFANYCLNWFKQIFITNKIMNELF